MHMMLHTDKVVQTTHVYPYNFQFLVEFGISYTEDMLFFSVAYPVSFFSIGPSKTW